MILIVSWPQDDHARAVQAHLEQQGIRTELVDLARFPTELELSVRCEPAGWVYQLRNDGKRLLLNEAKVVWWRRPRPFGLHREIAEGEYAAFAYSECTEAFAGLWQSLDVTWINHPVAEQVAAHKLYGLWVAREVGLDVPRTLVTNDPAEARRFAHGARPEAVAFKTFLPAVHDWRETRILRDGELERLETLSYAPVIFQEYIPLEFDLRITVVREEIIAAAIRPVAGAYEADYRMSLDRARVEEVKLPDEVADCIASLMRRLGLIYGAIDMRVTPRGRHVFLEINPTGEWRFIEERSGIPITAIFARHLAELAA